jgi:hypothetical protein
MTLAIGPFGGAPSRLGLRPGVIELAGGVSIPEHAARSVRRQTGQGSGLGLGWSVLCNVLPVTGSTGTPGNVA